MVREKSGFERHAQTVLGVVVAAGIIWLGNSNVDLGKELAKATVSISQLREDMRSMQDQIVRANADRVTTNDFNREVQRLNERMARIEARSESKGRP